MTAPTLRTERLVLRQLVLDDAAALFPILSDDAVMHYWSSGPHRHEDETREYLQWNADPNCGHHCWAITFTGEKALGWVILIPRRTGNFELGYILAREFWGQGLATEAISAALDFAFRTLKLRRVMADTDPENNGSIALLRKLGFRQEGHLRAEWETHIGVRDSLIFGLLQSEWRSPTR